MATSPPVLIVGPIPVEATGGSPFNDETYTGIRSMKIGHGDIVFSIQTEYDNIGRSVWSPTHGTTPYNAQIDEIKLDYPDEFLVSISGTITVEFAIKHLIIRTLRIQSNRRIYGTYGTARVGAQSFSTASTDCKIVGFHGRSGDAINSIGTYLVPPDPHNKISIGPFGGAFIFDDGKYPSIKMLEIGLGEGYVSLRTLYATDNGQNHWSDWHGHAVGGRVTPVVLDLPDEYLISLSGFCTEGSNPVVKSLTFQSNIKSYGPYGAKDGIPFSTSTTARTGKIVGFHGTSAGYINSIAAYFEPLP